MKKIKTNYNKDQKLVLLTDENNVAAIINVPKGADITEQLRLAIKEELIAKEVVFEGSEDLVISEFESFIYIEFIYSNDDDEEFNETFSLVITAEY